MEFLFTLVLPRDEVSVPVVRHLSRTLLERLGVSSECISDIEIAVSEGCTNVLRHARGSGSEYEVSVHINETQCEISVVDTGADFDVGILPASEAELTAESGRGVFLMSALVDKLDFDSDPGAGTVVRLRKSLELAPNSVMRRAPVT